MKSINKYLLASVILVIFSTSCEDFLDFPPEATVLEKDVFSTYINYQGYVDGIYQYIEDGNKSSITVGQQMGGETIARQGWNSSRAAADGNYLGLLNGRSIYKQFGNNNYGWWNGGWTAIRIANTAIANIDILQEGDATQEQVNLILGQAYFFRALFHMEIWRGFGAIPYIDEVLSGSVEAPRFFEVETDQFGTKSGCQAVAERIVQDLDQAASLLPVRWGDTWGRPTKGAAIAYKARTLLTAGSPLFNEYSGKAAEFDQEYMQRAAEAAAEVINLGEYTFQPFADRKDMYASNDGTFPDVNEVIFAVTEDNFGPGNVTGNGLGRLFLPHQALFGGNAITEAVTQNYVDKFERADGSAYDPDGDPSTASPYDTDDANRWNNRDPRFRASIYVDGDQAGVAPTTVLELYNGGKTRNNGNTLSPYIVHKYWPIGVNREDGLWDQFFYWTPLIRLADVYLMYAEAVYEGYGSSTATASNSSLTAEAAVNAIRSHAGMPDVATTISRNVLYNNFRDIVRNERAVELAFEGHYWFDLRRWKVKPDPILYEIQFDQAYSFFTREEILPFIFDDRHWWMPLPRDLTQSIEGFPQNPGWE